MRTIKAAVANDDDNVDDAIPISHFITALRYALYYTLRKSWCQRAEQRRRDFTMRTNTTGELVRIAMDA